MRNDQLIRQWTLLSLLDNSTGRNQQSLAAELSCSIRTVQRDLEALTIAGFPITNDVRGHEFYWYLNPRFGKPGIPLTLTELLALSVSRNFYSLLPIEALRRAYDSIINKVEAIIPAARTLTTITTRAVGAKNYDSHWNHLQMITEAIKARKSVSLTYYSYAKKELSIRKVDPYDLWHSQETIYLIGYCHLRQDVRLFALERIQHIEMTENGFDVREGYSLEALTTDRFRVMQEDESVTVRIRFAEAVADYVRDRKWHPTQQVEPQKDGSIILTIHAAGTTELLNWVLGYGPNAEILEPLALRERAARAIRKMDRIYNKMPKRPPASAARSQKQTDIRQKVPLRNRNA
ncbi:transcriptional regulator [bacterium]|nr:transcriptional regulator [bacterium]